MCRGSFLIITLKNTRTGHLKERLVKRAKEQILNAAGIIHHSMAPLYIQETAIPAFANNFHEGQCVLDLARSISTKVLWYD